MGGLAHSAAPTHLRVASRLRMASPAACCARTRHASPARYLSTGRRAPRHRHLHFVRLSLAPPCISLPKPYIDGARAFRGGHQPPVTPTDPTDPRRSRSLVGLVSSSLLQSMLPPPAVHRMQVSSTTAVSLGHQCLAMGMQRVQQKDRGSLLKGLE
ncbi:hypothetical protein SEVIR_6G133406v4 [Setaria viridis]